MHPNPKSSFAPIADADTEILILGTLPSDTSLQLGEYYGFAHNRFWRVMARITQSLFPENYEEKKALLLQSHIGIWDVAQRAERKGSLDSDIKKEIPNDIEGFLAQHPLVKKVVFNGKKAEALYDKYFSRKAEILYFTMPSTSPANAVYSLEKLVKEWKKVVE